MVTHGKSETEGMHLIIVFLLYHHMVEGQESTHETEKEGEDEPMVL